jgi:hypothetical protein
VTLLGLVARALTVALLCGVLLLPTADHHMGARLPGAHDLDAHHQMTHHHGVGASAAERGDAAPLLLPLGAAGVGLAVPFPLVDLPVGMRPPPLGSSALVEPAPGVPSSLLEPPPLPPPVRPA